MKAIKKAGVLLLCLAIALMAVPAVLFAEETHDITAGSAEGLRGDYIQIPVDLSSAADVAGGNFTLLYEPAALQLTDWTVGTALDGIYSLVNKNYYWKEDPSKGAVRVTFASTEGLASAGTLVTFTFRIRTDAPLGETGVTLAEAKLYDVNSSSVNCGTSAGTVEILSAGIGIGSDTCVPGQEVKLDVTLGGKAKVAGGEFELVCDPSKIEAVSVKPVVKLGNVAVSLISGVDAAAGRIKVSWAAAEPIAEPGRLCTVIFHAKDDAAAGETAVTFENVKFYNENGVKVDCGEAENGSITIVTTYNEQPTLYVVGGRLDEETNTATLNVAVDGAGIVCGGSFLLAYDKAACELLEATPGMACVAVNPETAGEADGALAVSWAEDSPALDNETVLQLKFAVTEASALAISSVALKDNAGETIEDVTVHSGRIGIGCGLQDPFASVEKGAEETVTLEATLYDAEFCGGEKTAEVFYILAAYKDGRMWLTQLPDDAVSFDHNGIAKISLDVAPAGADELKLFIVNDQSGLAPMCAGAEFALD
ncbi:MAG: hypothetical protein K5981_04985 [Clostridia bacterium]|nr:hypothetical protein [Clostridia bacterium]